MDNVNDDLVPPTLQVSAADRLQRFREDDQALAELAVKVHERAMGEGEGANAAAHTDLRIRERRACMWGYDAPQRTDMVLVAQGARPSSHEQMVATLNRFFDQLPPAQKALRQRLQEMTPEAALELLGPPQVSDAPGTDAPSDDD
jgi:hypothetical protein